MEPKYVVIYKHDNMTQTKQFPSEEQARIHIRNHNYELCDFYNRMGRKYTLTNHDSTTVLVLTNTMESMSWTIEERSDE